MDNPLGPLLEEGIISEVLGRLQSGKEAEVFIVRYGERVVAAKVYKDHSQRSFKNKSAYKEGRGVRNSRDQRAMGKRSAFGKDTEEDAWKSAEVDAMYKLHAAEVRIPAPVLYFEGVLLMDLVLDAEGVTARRLIDTTLSAEQANAAYHDMLVQLVRMLSCDLIHGDLSPYNVLWGAGGATIIDFPQIVSAAQNSNSERFFLRDAENILGYFRAIDPRLDARRGDAAEIWRAYMRRELSSDFLPTGRLHVPPPQKPLPIGASHAAGNAGSAARGSSPFQQPKRGGPPPQPYQGQPKRGGPPPQSYQGQPKRGGPPPQPYQGQPKRGGPPPQPYQGQPQRGGPPPQPYQGQPQRGAPPQQAQLQRDGRSFQPAYPRRDGRPVTQELARQQPQRAGRPSQQQPQRAVGAPQPQRHVARPASNGQARRAMPEVIVRPRLAAAAPASEARPVERADASVGPERPGASGSKRR